jgi:hypothetical protein
LKESEPRSHEDAKREERNKETRAINPRENKDYPDFAD